MAYADFTFYTLDFFGSMIAEEDFPRLALRASTYLDYYTRGKSSQQQDLPALKMACCALAERFQLIDSAETIANKTAAEGLSSGAEVQSESVGSWSKTYRSGGDTAKAAQEIIQNSERTLSDTARRYLVGTNLLYRGGRCVG
jgi:hypothetical protein